jgi:integrase
MPDPLIRLGREYAMRPSKRHIRADSFAAVIRAFTSAENPKWMGYRPATRVLWQHELALAERLEILGALSIEEIRPKHVQSFLDGLADFPGKQQAARKALKAVEKWALVRDLLPSPITYGTELVDHDGGYDPWTDEQVQIGEQCASPALSRAITLAANTGQRGSDLIRLSPTDIEIYQGRPGFRIKQVKTGRQLWVPMTAELQQKLETWERRPGPYLQPIPDRLALSSKWFRERRLRPALAPLKDMQLHGLRATAAVRLRRLGATDSQIAAMLGMDVRTVRTYCRLSDQKENALAAVLFLDARRPLENKDTIFQAGR